MRKLTRTAAAVFIAASLGTAIAPAANAGTADVALASPKALAGTTADWTPGDRPPAPRPWWR